MPIDGCRPAGQTRAPIGLAGLQTFLEGVELRHGLEYKSGLTVLQSYRVLIDQKFTENRADRFLFVRRDGRTKVLRGDDVQLPQPGDLIRVVRCRQSCAIFDKG